MNNIFSTSYFGRTCNKSLISLSSVARYQSIDQLCVQKANSFKGAKRKKKFVLALANQWATNINNPH